jgi:predicted nucleic acid-binding Zn ribbon protein
MKQHTRFCRVCGQPFRYVRFDAQVCSSTCAMRKSAQSDEALMKAIAAGDQSAMRTLYPRQ